ncbi:MAG: hypothetical protein F6K09_38480 [Merismopedia sp. SIO2A8]|nr:hypothetical protein [Symploca sp. SIO2B6]NET54282.1 hypothetical protein [Merismopedia sp. SIO2A8]
MNTDNLVQMMQKGFHITLGAASFLVETATSTDQQQRDDNLAKLQSGNFDRLSEEWASLGEQKEQEGRTFVESIVPGGFPGMPTDSSPVSQPTAGGPTIPADIQQDLQTIMTELTAIRESLKENS